MRKAHNILFLHFNTLEAELHGNTLEAWLQRRSYCVLAVQWHDLVSSHIKFIQWHGNWQELPLMVWYGRGILFKDLTYSSPTIKYCMCYSWDHFKSFSERDWVIGRDLLWWCETAGAYSLMTWLKVVPHINTVWYITHGTILSHSLNETR